MAKLSERTAWLACTVTEEQRRYFKQYLAGQGLTVQAFFEAAVQKAIEEGQSRQAGKRVPALQRK